LQTTPSKEDSKEGLFPKISLIISTFDEFISWEGPKKDIPTPK